MSALTVTIINQEKGELNPEFSVLSVDVCKELNRIPTAELVLVDGDVAKQHYVLADTGFFNPGQKITVKARYEGQTEKEQTLFSGVVSKQGLTFQGAGFKGNKSRLSVVLKDVAMSMAQNRLNRIHRDLSDADIIGFLSQEHGIQQAEITETTPVHPEMFQYYCSDWDFLMTRAQLQGLWVILDDGVLSARKIEAPAQPAHRLEYGLDSILGFSMAMDAGAQRPSITNQSWDIRNQSLSEPTDANELSLPQGETTAEAFSEQLNTLPATQINGVHLEQEELQAWADSTLIRNRMSLRRGTVSIPGRGDIKPFDWIELAGISREFNGQVLVSAVRHRLSVTQGWITDIQFGLSSESFAAKKDITDLPAAGLVPPVQGLCIGVIADVEQDPLESFRVKVVLANMSENSEPVWARLASGDAGNGRGFFFRPEVGDEVVVGFFNDDPRQAVVLGSLYSSAQPPFEEWSSIDEDNELKGIATKTGTKIEFSDQDDTGKLTIQTANNNRVVLDDESESIEISDQHNNVIVLGREGIEIKSAGDLKLSADGNVEISGSQVDVN